MIDRSQPRTIANTSKVGADGVGPDSLVGAIGIRSHSQLVGGIKSTSRPDRKAEDVARALNVRKLALESGVAALSVTSTGLSKESLTTVLSEPAIYQCQTL
jgi:hypothetical protein